MKISEIEKQLAEIKEQEGDIDCVNHFGSSIKKLIVAHKYDIECYSKEARFDIYD